MRTSQEKKRNCLLVLGFVACLGGCAAKVQAPPEPPATVRRAEEAFRLRDFERAIELYQTYAALIRRDPYIPRVLYKAALAQYQLGRYEDVLATLNDLEDRYPNRRWVQVEALRGDTQAALSRPLVAIQAWESALSVARPADEGKLRLRIATVASKMGEEELREAVETASSAPVRELLLAQLSQREHPEIPEPLPDFVGEEPWEHSVESAGTAPPTEAVEREEAIAREPLPPGESPAAQEFLPSEVRVGVLLEGAGGTEWVEAVRLALGEQAVVVVNVSGAADVESAWERLVAQPGIVAVFSDVRGGADRLGARAHQLAIPVIDVTVGGQAPTGPYWVAANIDERAALSALLDYAVSRARLRRFGVVYPNTLQGRQFFHRLEEELTRRGAVIVGADAYAPDAKSLTAGLVRRWRDQENVQAIVLSDNVLAAATFARFLQSEMPDIPLLGIEDWSGLAEMVPGVSGVIFVASVVTEPSESLPWVREFTARTGHLPSPQALAAYEAAIGLEEVLSGAASEPLTRAQLWQAIESSRIVQAPRGDDEQDRQRLVRQPAVVQFTRGRLESVPPAWIGEEPESFGSPANPAL